MRARKPPPARDPLVDEVRRVGRLLGHRGIFVADDGNISVRAADGTVWITARGSRKDALAPSDLSRIDPRGNVLEGARNPSSEFRLHLAVYELRKDAGAVVHAHPPVASGFAAARRGLSDDALAEAAVALGPVPVVPYQTLGTEEAVEAARPFLAAHQAVLLANHGAVTMGRNLEDACRRMERLEHVARSLLVARLLGGEHPLTREQREALGI